MPDRVPRVVIVGGGFGGIEVAKALRNASCQVTLVDRTNHHLFQPLLYQVAMATISSVEIAYPIRSIFRDDKNITVLMATVTAIDLEQRVVRLDAEQDLPYDYLVIAVGTQNSYFGHTDWEKHAIGLKTLRDAYSIRRQVLLCFESAEKLEAAQRPDGLLTFVIIGGGPTGVELAGSLAELSQHVISKDFRNVEPSASKIILIEGTGRILPTYPEGVSAKADEKLRQFGVEILKNTFVTDITQSGVQIGDKFIPAITKLWCAGVAPNPLAKNLSDLSGVKLERGRIVVDENLALPSHPNVFAIGDIAYFLQEGAPLPGVAPVAIQQGQSVGAFIKDKLAGRAGKPFRYQDRGTLATIGRSAAVGVIGKWQFSGRFAWLTWVLIHIMNLIGFRNRMVVMFDWLWSYVTFQRGARLIVERGVEQNLDIEQFAKSLDEKPAAELTKQNT